MRATVRPPEMRETDGVSRQRDKCEHRGAKQHNHHELRGQSFCGRKRADDFDRPKCDDRKGRDHHGRERRAYFASRSRFSGMRK